MLVQGELQQSILTPDLGTLLRLEGCLSGNVPEEGLRTLPEVCTWFAQEQPAKVVYGPGTFVNTAASQIAEGFTAKQAAKAQEAEAAAEAARRLAKRRGDPPAEQERLAEQARSLVFAQFTEETLRLALRYGLTSVPSLDNIDFVSQLVFDPSRGVGQPKARFAYLFPSDDAALIQIRHEADADGVGARGGGRPDPGGRRPRAVRARAGRPLRRDRRAGRRGRGWRTRSRTRSSSCSWPRCS